MAIRLVAVSTALTGIVVSDLPDPLRWVIGTVGTVAFVACIICVQLIAAELADVAYRSRVIVPHVLTPWTAFWLTLLGSVTFGLTSLIAAARLWRATVSLLGVIGPERSRQLSKLWPLAIFFPEWILQKEMVVIDHAIRSGGGRVPEPVRPVVASDSHSPADPSNPTS